jgi:hypothetical protein
MTGSLIKTGYPITDIENKMGLHGKKKKGSGIIAEV